MITEFTYHGNAKTLNTFAESIGASLQSGRLNIKRNELHGIVHTMELEQGLEFSAWDVQIEEDFTFLNHFRTDEEKAPHLLCYYLDPQFESIHIGNGQILKHRRNIPCNLLIHNSTSVEFRFKKGSAIKCLCIGVNATWIETQGLFGIQESWERFNNEKSVFLFPLTKTEFFLAKEVYDNMIDEKNLLKIKSYAYNLLHHFVQTKQEQVLKTDNLEYTEVLLQIEQKMQAQIFSTMPSILELSKEFYISPSTLRRQFKKLYGVNIYEYYIQTKMKAAITLLKEKKTVAEVACILGYESVSHFIDMFRKQHGVSPGQLEKA